MTRLTVAAILALAVSATAQKCINGTKTANATFDTLKAGTSPPDGYKLLDWFGWTVNPPPSGSAIPNVAPASAPNVLVADNPQLGYMRIAANASAVSFTLESFEAACYHYVGSFGPSPENCDFTVTYKTDFTEDDSFGTNVYSYTKYNASARTQAQMQKFQGRGAQGNSIYFALIGQPGHPGLSGNTGLLIDNVVVSESC